MTSFLKRMRSGVRFDPVRDWLIVLTLSIIVLSGIIVWNAWAFDTVARGDAIGTKTTEPPSVFSRASLDAIHAVFENRAEEELKYQTGVYRYVDPSL